MQKAQSTAQPTWLETQIVARRQSLALESFGWMERSLFSASRKTLGFAQDDTGIEFLQLASPLSEPSPASPPSPSGIQTVSTLCPSAKASR